MKKIISLLAVAGLTLSTFAFAETDTASVASADSSAKSELMVADASTTTGNQMTAEGEKKAVKHHHKKAHHHKCHCKHEKENAKEEHKD